MAQDETYNTITYHENGGDRHVIGSGGTLAIESGGSMRVADSGTLTLQEGATLSIVTGASIGIAGTGFSPEELTRLIVSERVATSELPILNATKLLQLNMPKNHDVHMIAASATMVSTSFWMTSCSAGRECWLGLAGDSTGTFTNKDTQVEVSTSGCIILNSEGKAISNFLMNASGNSGCLVHLMAVHDNVWAIIGSRGDINEAV